MSEVTDPDGQVEEDVAANRIIAVAPSGGAAPAVLVDEE